MALMPVPPLRIGPFQLATNLLLAPIAGYCDLSFRLVARSCGGIGLACTDLLCPQGILHETRKSMELAATCPEDSPLCMQLYGGAGDPLPEAARWAEDHGAAVVDLNMGCPADKITTRQGGSSLLCDPDAALRLIEPLVRALRRIPLTVKMRLGWDGQHIVAPYLATRMEEFGVAAITIHGRTTEQKFSGNVNLDGIARVVSSVRRIPIIGNGDVRTPRDAQRMIESTGCDGVMIGRAALSSPWIFRDTWSWLTTGQIPPEPTLEEKCRLMRRHFQNLSRFRGERVAILEFRRRASWYAKTMHPCETFRQEMRTINSSGDFERAIQRFLGWRRGSESASGQSAPIPRTTA